LIPCASWIIGSRSYDESLIPGLRALQFEVNDTIARVCVDLYGPGAEQCRPLQQAVDLSFTFFHGLGSGAWVNDDGWQAEQLALWSKIIRPLLDQAERELS